MNKLEKILVTAFSLVSFAFAGNALSQEKPQHQKNHTIIKQVYCEDKDNDGDGDPSKSIYAESLPAGYSVSCGDCNDFNPNIHSEYTNILNEVCKIDEICINNIDEDCDNEVDEAECKCTDLDLKNYCAGDCCLDTEICFEEQCCTPKIFYKDNDGDGLGNPKIKSKKTCKAPKGFVDNKNDCNDNNPKLKKKKICDYNGRYSGEFELCIEKCPTVYRDDEGDICTGKDCDFVYDQKVQILEYDKDKVEYISGNDDIIVFDSSSEFARNLATNDYVVSGRSDDTPNGLMKKVVSVDKQDDFIIVETEDASLEDIIKKARLKIKGKIHTKKQVSFEKESSVFASASLVEYLERDKQFSSTPSETRLELKKDNMKLYEGEELYLNSNVSLTTSVDYVIVIEDHELMNKLFRVYNQNSFDLTVYGEFIGNLHAGEKTFEIKFDKSINLVGDFPLIIEPKLHLKYGLDAKGEGKTSLNADMNLSIDGKIDNEYSKETGELPELESYTPSFNYKNKPRINTGFNAYVKAHITTEFSINVNGNYGIGIITYGSLELNVRKVDSEQRCEFNGDISTSSTTTDNSLQRPKSFKKVLKLFSEIIHYDPDLCIPAWYTTCLDINNDGIGDVVSMDSCDKVDEVIQECRKSEYCDNAECRNKLGGFYSTVLKRMGEPNAEHLGRN